MRTITQQIKGVFLSNHLTYCITCQADLGSKQEFKLDSIGDRCKMLILGQMLAGRMEDEIGYLHRQHSMQVSSFGNKKQPLYIQLYCDIQGKPSEK